MGLKGFRVLGHKKRGPLSTKEAFDRCRCLRPASMDLWLCSALGLLMIVFVVIIMIIMVVILAIIVLDIRVIISPLL